jgi:hypothetical protein
MKKAIMILMVLSFTIYLKTGEIFKTKSLIDMGNLGVISF